MLKNEIKKIKKYYDEGYNIIELLKKRKNIMKNTDEMVKISYDFQSGSYIQSVKENPKFNKKYTEAIAKVINSLDTDFNSILEAGVGEATTLANLIPKLKDYPEKIFGFDLSWSRARYARSYCENNHIKNAEIFVGNIFNIPLADDSIEIVYTSHSIEPNGGREEEALLELMRITKKYLILLEPDYELASSEAKKRMEKHGYIKKLYSTAVHFKKYNSHKNIKKISRIG